MNGRTPLHMAVRHDWTKHSNDAIGGRNPQESATGTASEERALACLDFLVAVARVPLSQLDNFGDTSPGESVIRTDNDSNDSKATMQTPKE